jgi:hypothetical protein
MKESTMLIWVLLLLAGAAIYGAARIAETAAQLPEAAPREWRGLPLQANGKPERQWTCSQIREQAEFLALAHETRSAGFKPRASRSPPQRWAACRTHHLP